MKNILLVEDDALLADNISKILSDELYNVSIASSLAEIGPDKKDLIILDWRLPDGRGIDFLKSFRSNNHSTPVLMLTSKSDVEDKVLGLELGANDYMTKPFSAKELLARIAVQLRTKLEPQSNELIFKDLSICLNSRSVKINDRTVDLTKLEFDLLVLLAQNNQKVFSRDEILNVVWGFDSFPTTRTVDMHIKQLRQKIGNQYFTTVHGVGYKINLP